MDTQALFFRMRLALVLAIVSAALGPARPAAAQQTQSWGIAIEQIAMTTMCGGQTNIPVAGATSLSGAITAATNVFNNYIASCLAPQCPPNSTITVNTATGVADPYVVNGNPRTRYQITITYTCSSPAGGEGFDVGIRKRGPEGPLTVGQTATFTLSPFNTGPSAVDGGSGVVVTDALPPNFTAPVTATGAGWTCTVSGQVVTCTYGGPSVGRNQQLPAITITAVVGREGRYENCADITLRPRDAVGPRGGDVRDANPRDNRDCVQGEIRPGGGGGEGFDVGIRKRGPAGPLTVGQTATFTLSPFNTGPSAVDGGSGVVVTDTLPGNFTAPVTATGAGWTCTVTGPVVTCVYGGPAVSRNQPLPEIRITAVVAKEGGYRNCADIALRPRDAAGPRGADIRDTNPRDNRDCVQGEIRPGGGGGEGFDVGIRKRGPEGPLTVGQTATFTLSPFNTGPSAVDGGSGVVVTDELPRNFGAPVTVAGTGWTCTVSVSGQLVSCVYGGPPVPAGQPLPVITITVSAQTDGRYENCAEITLEPRDSNPRDNRGCVQGQITPGGGGVAVEVKPDLTPTPLTQLRVVKRLVPPSDPGRFNLFIDGQLPGGAFGSAQAVGDNGTTGFVSVAAGQHFVNEAGAMFVGPMEDHYTTTYSANCPGGYITLQPGASETCTITNIRKHGSWTQGPGTYTVTVCAPPATCTIPGTAGQSIEITFEVWGGGGGGGAGGPAYSGAPEDTQGGNGGGGGGGGGYGKTTITTTVPTAGTTAFHVNVGTGGAGGSVGGFSEVRSGSSGGTVVVKATGGAGGHSGDGHGGASGIGTLNNWAGLSGGNGSVVSGCNGGAGGAGGVGGGPGAINNGGDGGHGGYLHIIEWWATCTAQSMDGGLTSGAAGMNGLVKITW